MRALLKIILLVFFLFLNGCNVDKQENSFKLFNVDSNKIRITIIDNNDSIKLNKIDSKKVYEILKKSYNDSLIRGQREYTLKTLNTIVIYKDDIIYKLIINKTEKNRTSINYFIHKEQTNYNKYFGRNYIDKYIYNEIIGVIASSKVSTLPK